MREIFGIFYEYSNHLGNVLATVSDRKLAVVSGGLDIVDYYDADVTSTTEYYPYGMTLRSETDGSKYLYGYQGSEKDDEIKGQGNSYTTHFRQLDPRIGKWLSVDPKATPWESPYSSMGNNPIFYNDMQGDSIWWTINEGVATLHFSGKVIDLSGKEVLVDEAISDIKSHIESEFQGTIEIDGKIYEMETSVELEKITDLNYVKDSDHLVVFARGGITKKGVVRGLAAQYGGKTLFLNSADYESNSIFSWGSYTKSAAHEFGHLLGLGHYTKRGYNLMKQGPGWSLTQDQLQFTYDNRLNINKGNTTILRGGVITVNPFVKAKNGEVGPISHEDINLHINNDGDVKRKVLKYIPANYPVSKDQDRTNPYNWKPEYEVEIPEFYKSP